ncbi:MAG: glycosyltransferase [Bradyrhizobium sp.]|uniref:glycosyltransferase family 4 protein n=1 Tax=Bradyrhizobium sp. TaxID=376 RepID=UPI0012256D98|nr:glycosyltransferase family 4 protein [Bradyrhizobium sp.]THD73079.1 MAG: glycosyltransferase [Bradyrhizobium sp.]
MKILHFYKTYLPDSHGGIEQFIYQLARGCAQRGLEIDVLSLSSDVTDESNLYDNHVSHRVRKNLEIASTGISIRSFAKFAALASRADIIHYHHPWPFADIVHFATGVSKPTVLTYHSDIVRQQRWMKLYKPLMNRFLGSIDRIVATSPNYLETSQTLMAFREKTEVIPIGLDRLAYPTPDASRIDRWRAQLGEGFFLFVGMLRYYKGLHILFEANRGTNFPVVIVGAGPVEAELRKHAADAGLTKVTFLGTISEIDKVALFMLSRAVVLPSHLRSEAFGISLLEGAMFGKPMISSEIGTGTSYINKHEETGLVVPAADPGALGEAMRLLVDNPARGTEMGHRAFLRYQEYFSASQMVDRYVNLYGRVMSQHRT